MNMTTAYYKVRSDNKNYFTLGEHSMNTEAHENISHNHHPRAASSVERVSERTDLSKSYIRNEIRAGNLRAIRRGRRVLILEDDLQAYLRGSMGSDTAAPDREGASDLVAPKKG